MSPADRAAVVAWIEWQRWRQQVQRDAAKLGADSWMVDDHPERRWASTTKPARAAKAYRDVAALPTGPSMRKVSTHA